MYKVSYYSSYKEWTNQFGIQYWPGYAILGIAITIGLFTKYSDPALYLAIAGVIVMLFCVIYTGFYANATLSITGDSLLIIKGGKSVDYNWRDIQRLVFITAENKKAFREVVLAIITQNKVVDYVIIESLYFKAANRRALEISLDIEAYLKGYQFKIYKSDFNPMACLKQKDILPRIYEEQI